MADPQSGKRVTEREEGSSELTTFAPFETDKSTALAYKGEATKPSQVEINDSSYFGQPKVLFRKLRATTMTSRGQTSPRTSPQPPTTEAERQRAPQKRARATIGGARGRGDPEREQPSSKQTRGGGGGPPVVRVSKSLVMNRIGTLEKEQDTSYDLKRYWMPDSACKECSECGTRFNLIIRRHHCRICGRIFCNACCSLTIPGIELRPGLQGNLRVCKECLEIFREFQSMKRSEGPGLTSDPQGSEHLPSVRTGSNSLQKNQVEQQGGGGGGDGANLFRVGSGNFSRTARPKNILSPHKSWDDASSGRSQDDLHVSPSMSRLNGGFDNPTPLRALSGRKDSFDSFHEREETLLALNEDEVEYVITHIWFQFTSQETGVPPQNHRYRLRNFPNTFSATEIITWLMANGHARTREIAIRMGQALVETKRLRVVSSLDSQFKDEPNLFLEFGEAAVMAEDYPESPTDLDAPKWFQGLPEDGDSEAERSHVLSTNDEHLRVRYSVPPNIRSGSFLTSTQPTITISSMSELTGVIDPSTVVTMTVQPQDDYLVITHDKDNTSPPRLSPGDGTGDLKLSLHGDDHSVSLAVPSPPPPSLPPPFAPHSPGQQSVSFTVVNDREIMKAIPVAGLSSAADAAQDLESEGGKDVKSNEEARAVFDMEHINHFDATMIQLIKSFGISLRWLRVIKPLIMEAARKTRTNVYSTDIMDIKEYVKVKKIPGGRKNDSALISGVVCTKNITHKKMQISIRNPTILLLKCAFEFQRKENQMSSFDTLQMQEEKYLKNLVARVKTFHPRVILVQKSVARLALEMLYHLDIVVAVNVKPSVMERVARCTQGDLLHSLDQLFFNVQLGSCGQFYLRNFTLPDGIKKTLMYFDNCDPRLGCAITLQGGTKRELKKVKKVTLFGLYIAYNSQLESSFLVDEFAWPVSSNPQLLPDTDGYSSSPSTPEWPLYPSLSFPLSEVLSDELRQKLQALAPEYRAGEEHDEPSCRSTPTLSSLGRCSSNKSPLTSVAHAFTSGGHSSEQSLPNLVVTTEEGESPDVATLVDKPTSQSEPNLLEKAKAAEEDSALCLQLGRREFEKALELQILSITPRVKFPIPYLQSPEGFSADIRKYLPPVIYWSYQFLIQDRSATPESASQSIQLSLVQSGVTSPVEMGISKTVLKDESNRLSCHVPEPEQGNRFSRSYHSVSEHPLTSSIFLLKANTNEMKAALADFRAHTGLANPTNSFFFPSAARASDYRMHLQNIFNKYQQLEIEGDTSNQLEAEEGERRGEEEGKGEGEGEERERRVGAEVTLETLSEEKPLRQRGKRQPTPSLTVSGEGGRREGSPALRDSLSVSGEKAQKAAGVVESGSGNRGREREEGRRRRDSKQRSGRSTTPLVTMGTLDDIDRDYSRQQVPEGEEEGLDLHGNEDWSLPPVSEHLTAQFPPFQQVDCMDPMHHQSISILFSSTCHDGQRHQVPCVPPCIIQMLYYSRNDISLGDFLKRYCFRPDYRCQSCGSEMTKHQRHVVHGERALHISMQQLDTSIPGSNDGIFTWLACKHCASCTPYKKMSENSLLYSFAKFLELKFHCNQFVTRFHSNSDSGCQHSLHSDYLHYFCYCNKIACFQPAAISILEVCVPPTVIAINTPHSEYHHSFALEIKHIQRITEGVCYRIRQRLLQYNAEPVEDQVKEHIASSKAERDAFRARIKLLKEKVVSGGFLETGEQTHSDEEMEAEFVSLQDGIAEVKRALTELVCCWNIELEALDAKLRIFYTRRDVSTNRDRDSPFTPLAAEVSNTRDLVPRLSPYTTPRDSPPLFTPVASPDKDEEEEASSTVEGGSSNLPSPGTEVGIEAAASEEELLSERQDESSSIRGTPSPRKMEDVGKEQIVERTSLTREKEKEREVEEEKREEEEEEEGSEMVEGKREEEEEEGEGEREEEGMEKARSLASLQTALLPSTLEGTDEQDSETDDAEETIPLSFRRRSGAFSQSSSEISHSGSSSLKRREQLEGSFERANQVSSPNEERQAATPTITVTDDVNQEGEGGGGGGGGGEGGSERGSPHSSDPGNNRGSSPGELASPSESEDKEEYQRVRTLLAPNGGARGDSGGHRTPVHGEEVHSDGVGIFAKLRGTKDKDTEVREDPTRFYLVDPAQMAKDNPSPALPHRIVDVPSSQPRPHRRPGTIPRKTGSSNVSSTTEALGDAKAARLQRERERLFSRPFQRLPPPFELNEHHDMHKSLKIPIAIYEKEPTSQIAYALSSREYAQEYWALVERRQAAQHESKSRPPSPKVPKKLAEPPPTQAPPPSKTSALKQAYQELKKKGSLTAMNVLSGLTMSTSDRSDRSDPFDKSNDDSRRLEAALSSKSSQTSLSSMPATDQSTMGEDGEGFRWNTTGESASSGGSSKAGHICLEFTAPNSSRFFCKVYFAEEFQHLRELIFPSGEDKFIRSLSRCVKFDAKGGKSRSTFCKVIDDRFIMKQIKSVEISSFEQIAPQYFEHVTSALENKRPLVLAKILGVYTIGFRNTRTGNSKRLDVIVMENLLYGRKSSKVFDLKGSMRSRYIDPSKDSSSDVLLDENYLNHICYTPVYVHPHSKAVLMRAIQEDTEFLARNAIMDYSLLTCIDDQTGELVVGIIDYVRTFTLDKRLEMYIKKTAGRVLPTVVYPELYRKRFCEAMDRYFTAVPDKWTGLGSDVKL